VSEQTTLKQIREDFEYGPDQVMTGRFTRDERGIGFNPDYSNGIPGVDANGVRLPQEPGKRMSRRAAHERARQQVRKMRGDTLPLRPLGPPGYTWCSGHRKSSEEMIAWIDASKDKFYGISQQTQYGS
ncbi:MAG: hypothetical protein Q9173_007259, partial [Seirophora scorigena]